MQDTQGIEKIMQSTNCSFVVAETAWSKTHNLTEAKRLVVDLMREETYIGGGSSGLTVMNPRIRNMTRYEIGN